ncbi:5'-methylthioadenosine phosphorylase [Amycolatopsis bartoniae]|uniref:S-methyl-5'-thioadenosine phosphorylase n=1 Tax=Amycolatopsis bartoniae TaxID=941986 RepID=A0A8H9MBB6_9PSEU|nr:S-methyl-5'-thioadenosine phosphorylase [Amycolatopsis bartoniae]MBB2939809.1 5'-methylthioadenosine phosphorylase [Amycolatopsis bartoniae]TVT07482.1 S-methyl-5'-thioadenosine phosphorylase [Amycolatopsis bartoniae]GHF54668.1 S-methyl-5'-thioadenosine phosphorylase [Amycolatopsis bartoniae]
MAPRHSEAETGIIGGSGLYDFSALEEPSEYRLSTPFGEPSDRIVVGGLRGRRVAFLSRHGRRHQHPPSAVPAAANIYAMKYLGVTEILSVSAVGSLRDELRPGELVVPDQLVDLTRGGRTSSFFSSGLVAHLPFADPYCPRLRRLVLDAVRTVPGTVSHDGGTYVCIEGPQFSTRAESGLYRSWGMDVIGMTAAPEAKLAREAGICLATIALVTDYDCWRQGEESVTADLVAEVMRRNVAAAKQAITSYVDTSPPARHCDCHDALAQAILSDPSAVPDADRRRVDLLAGRYLDEHQPARD